jgi:hypothetical protein
MIYEATCFAADNNALELRELKKLEPSKFPAVQAARDAFFNQPMFRQKAIWDKYAFDGDKQTEFYALSDRKINGGLLRIDCGEKIQLDRIIITGHHLTLDSKNPLNNSLRVECSGDLKTWTPLIWRLTTDLTVECPSTPIRYFRIYNIVECITEVVGYRNGKVVDRSKWRASNLFSPYDKMKFRHAWNTSVTLPEIPKNSYLAVPIYGWHGQEGAYVGFVIDNEPVGSPDRSPSFMSNVWEHYNARVWRGYCYYLPLDPKWVNKKIEVYVLANGGWKAKKIRPEVWITAHPPPYESKKLILS